MQRLLDHLGLRFTGCLKMHEALAAGCPTAALEMHQVTAVAGRTQQTHRDGEPRLVATGEEDAHLGGAKRQRARLRHAVGQSSLQCQVSRYNLHTRKADIYIAAADEEAQTI